jgi:hypothetical protein
LRKRFDSIIYPYSRISGLPRFLQPLALVIRHIIRTGPSYAHEFDGVATAHNLACLKEPKFEFALKKAILAGGFDYQIYMRQHQAIWCAETALRLNENGCFVEIGTAKGYTMTTILSSLKYQGKDLSKVPVYLFDTFSPHATDSRGLQHRKFGKNIYYAESLEHARKNFLHFPNVRLIQGTLPQSLDLLEVDPISFLHIDLNVPEIEIQCLRLLWDYILPSGIILIDDFAYSGYEYTHKLFTEFCLEKDISILTTPYGPGVIFR